MGYIKLGLEFECVTGLLIRMPVHAQVYKIGGAELYPMTTRRYYNSLRRVIEVPYVPGSSLKGRMRGLLELGMGLKLYTTDRKIWQHVRSLTAMGVEEFTKCAHERIVVDELFGWPAANFSQIKDEWAKVLGRGREGEEKREAERKAEEKTKEVYEKLAVTRLLFSDFFPSEEFVSKLRPASVADFLEEKSENRIDRITAAADPRQVVRVAPGVRFEGDVTLLVFDNDRGMVEGYLRTLATGLRLIEETYLGGGGSRGYGRVKFNKIRVKAYRISVDGGKWPRVEEVKVEPEEYGSLDQFEEAIEKMAEVLEEHYWGGCGEA